MGGDWEFLIGEDSVSDGTEGYYAGRQRKHRAGMYTCIYG
jgi:hypothetical protein